MEDQVSDDGSVYQRLLNAQHTLHGILQVKQDYRLSAPAFCTPLSVTINMSISNTQMVNNWLRLLNFTTVEQLCAIWSAERPMKPPRTRIIVLDGGA